ncbi:putative dynein light chain, type protein [Helianthus annuus]|nr:putative dynein light chain, type protein [Helianthus annuus]KAJ0710067.1 putative dynein light chain, type protein [Helianthus annuus]
MATNKKTVMHVYKLDTGNRPPEPHHNHLSTTTTTTKKIIVKSLGALLRRSKTYRENNHNHIHNHNINSTKEDTKEVVLETSRKSLPAIDSDRSVVPAIKDGRKSASVVEEGRKGAPGVEVGVVAGRRSAENRAEMVMINVAEVADLYQVRVLVTDMPAFMQVHAFRCARRTFDSLDETSPRQIACNMKKNCLQLTLAITAPSFHQRLFRANVRRSPPFITWTAELPSAHSFHVFTLLIAPL